MGMISYFGTKGKGGSVGASLGVKREGLMPSRLICCRLVMPVILVDNYYQFDFI